ncbi:MAG: hypothetical protein ACREKH_12570, partial [Candidatus Rokuibacteriota bacterium]
MTRRLATYLVTPVLMVGFVLGIELGLEVRHHLKGYETLLLDPVLSATRPRAPQASAASTAAMVEGYVFRSGPVPVDRTPGVVRIWVASASHGEHTSLPVVEIFPNRICDEVKRRRTACEILNASKAGLLIADNIRWLREAGRRYRPDFAVLYQQGTEIMRAQRDFLGERTFRDEARPLVDLHAVRVLLQRSSIYPLTHQYLGGTSLLSGFMKEALPPAAKARYLELVQAFIAESRTLGIEPVITTFAASHARGNLDRMSHAERLGFVKWEHHLSPRGWVETIAEWN